MHGKGINSAKGGDGSRAPVTGSDTVGEKLQPSDLRHTGKIKGQSFQKLSALMEERQEKENTKKK